MGEEPLYGAASLASGKGPMTVWFWARELERLPEGAEVFATIPGAEVRHASVEHVAAVEWEEMNVARGGVPDA